jgi:nicotinamide-nucleotide amidase
MIDEQTVSDFNESLKKHQLTIFCAESITAGLLASTIASVSGASAVLKGSIVTYQAAIKEKLLGVDGSIIQQHTAESAETTLAMAKGLEALQLGADIYVAITGVASLPVNGSDYEVNKPVGQVYVAICYKGRCQEFETVINEEGRNPIRQAAVKFALEKVREVAGL